MSCSEPGPRSQHEPARDPSSLPLRSTLLPSSISKADSCHQAPTFPHCHISLSSRTSATPGQGQTRRLAPHVFASARPRRGAEERVRFRVQAKIELIAAVKLQPSLEAKKQSALGYISQTCLPSSEKRRFALCRCSALVSVQCVPSSLYGDGVVARLSDTPVGSWLSGVCNRNVPACKPLFRARGD